VLIGLTYVFERLVWVALIAPLALVSWSWVRRRVVVPRTGYVEFSRTRRERSGREMSAIIGVGVGALALVAFGAIQLAGGGPAHLVAGFPAVLLAMCAAVAGGLTRARRFGVYGLVFMAAAAATVVLETDPGWPIVGAGLVIWAAGSVLLGRFLSASRRFEEAGV